jgi:AraC-like DNA-binding protein/mannose-6-phosphate isomerase-like protein (cupin superfamily)
MFKPFNFGENYCRLNRSKPIAEQIPVYSVHNFSNTGNAARQFEVEIFDTNRHFSVKYPHRHDFFEVLFLMRGTGFHVIDGNKYEIQPPCVFFMSPGQAHKIDFSSDIEGFIYIFTSDFYLINQTNRNRLLEFPFFFTLRRDNPPLILNNPADVRFLEILFQKAIAETGNSDGVSVDLLRSVLDLILTSCSVLYQTDEPMVAGTKGHVVVKKFFQLLEENYQNNLTVNEYAGLLAITPNHLTQTLIALTGKTSNQIIKAKQILEIKRLLVHTNLPISEIAHQLNFADQSYFTKFFKRETGLSPLQYRVSE